MRTQYFLLLWLFIFVLCSSGISQTFPDFVLISPQGKGIPLEVEDLTGIKDQPLAKTKMRFDNKYGKDFFLLFRAKIAAGTQVTGQYKITKDPLRITVFEISKQLNSDRRIRIVATGFYQAGETAEFQTEIGNLEENIFFITAEAVESKDQLNPYLQHIDQVDNVILKGYSTNLSFSVLKMKFSGKDTSGNVVQVTEDFDWLVNQLVDSVHVISIRVELN
jgi:predicted regulator of amino acid metabolism with ACT domain